MGTPSSKGGICRASMACDGESRGTRADEALCLGVRFGERAERAPRVRAMSKMEGRPRVRARRGIGVRLFEVRCTWWGFEWRETR